MKRPTMKAIKRAEGVIMMRALDDPKGSWAGSALWRHLEAVLPAPLLAHILVIKPRRHRGHSFIELAVKAAQADAVRPWLNKVFRKVVPVVPWAVPT